MIRRLHTRELYVGEITLDPQQARHARDVLRLAEGERVELFDDAGVIGTGEIVRCGPEAVAVQVIFTESPRPAVCLNVASAVPKGERADWMVEKLSEIGVDRFIPLATERAVVLPEGKNKRERWVRLATESAKQSRRRGVMRIEDLADLRTLLPEPAGEVEQLLVGQRPGGASGRPARGTAPRQTLPGLIVYLTTEPGAVPLFRLEPTIRAARHVTLLVGPEGGWTDAELSRFRAGGLTGVKLTETILRVETAAVCGAAVVATLLAAG